MTAGIIDRCTRLVDLGLPCIDIDCAGGIIRFCRPAEAIACSIDGGRTWHVPVAAAPIRSIFMAELEGRAIVARLVSERAKRALEQDRWRERSGRLSAVDRARRYVARMDPSISGSGGSLQLLRVASVLVGFGLGDDEALVLLDEFNDRCAPPWHQRDLRAKWRQAVREKRIEPGSLLDRERAA